MHHQLPQFPQQPPHVVNNNNMRPPLPMQGQFFSQQQMQQCQAQLQPGMLPPSVAVGSSQPALGPCNSALGIPASNFSAGFSTLSNYGAASFAGQTFTTSPNVATSSSAGINTFPNYGTSTFVGQAFPTNPIIPTSSSAGLNMNVTHSSGLNILDAGSKSVANFGSGMLSNAGTGFGATSRTKWPAEKNSNLQSPTDMMNSTHQPASAKTSRKNKPRCIILPQWLKLAISPSQSSSKTDFLLPCVREVYTRALGLVECSSTDALNSNSANNIVQIDQAGGSRSAPASDWVETNRVSLLLLRTGLHANVLAVLWEIVSCSRAGQLSRTECAGLLALIALVQSGQHLVSAEVLEKLEEPVVPVIDHPALVPFIQQFQQSKLQQQKPQPDPLTFQQPVAPLLPNQTAFGAIPSQQNAIAQPSNWSASNDHSKSNDFNDADEFDDFVAAPLPPAGNAPSTGGSSLAFNSSFQGPNSLNPLPVATTQLSSNTFPGFSLAPQSSNAPLQPVSAAPALNGTGVVPAIDKHMNLPKVGCSPENSPSLSCENSAEDDFDDFQSATSEPAGMLSSDGSPRSLHHQLNGSSKACANKSLIESNTQNINLNQPVADVPSVSTGQFADFSSSFAPPTSVGNVETGLSVLKPAKINTVSSEDKYAAFRALDLGESDTTQQEVNKNTGLMQSSLSDDSFGDFCSANKQLEDDGFGSFTSATVSVSSAPAVTGGASAFKADFETGFSSIGSQMSSGHSNIETHTAATPVLSQRNFNVASLFGSDAEEVNSSSLSNNASEGKNSENFQCLSGNLSLPVSTTVQSENSHNDSKKISAGPSDWSDIFGVLHDTPRPSSMLQGPGLSSASLSGPKAEISTKTEAPFSGFSEEPPPFPDQSGDEFGDFVLPEQETVAAAPPVPVPLPVIGLNPELPPMSSAATSDRAKNEELFPPQQLNFVDFTQANIAGMESNASVFQNMNIDTKVNVPPATEMPPPLDDDVAISKLETLKLDGASDRSSVGERMSPAVCSDALSLDKYSSFREDVMLGASQSTTGGEGAPEDCWLRCVKACERLLEDTLHALQPLAELPPRGDGGQGEADLDWRKIAATQQMKDFIAGAKEVGAVSRRVEQAYQKAAPCPPLTDSLRACAGLAAKLSLLLRPLHELSDLFDATDSPDPTALRPTAAEESVCAVCLTALGSSPSSAASHSLTYAGHSYHPGCANFWLNCVDPTLPSLSPAFISVL